MSKVDCKKIGPKKLIFTVQPLNQVSRPHQVCPTCGPECRMLPDIMLQFQTVRQNRMSTLIWNNSCEKSKRFSAVLGKVGIWLNSILCYLKLSCSSNFLDFQPNANKPIKFYSKILIRNCILWLHSTVFTVGRHYWEPFRMADDGNQCTWHKFHW